MPKSLKKVIEFIDECAANYPDSRREHDIFYANGNDGTSFDWSVNDNLCELGYGYLDSDVWAFKCFVNKNGSVVVYCYPNGEFCSVKDYRKDLLTPNQAAYLKRVMQKTFDDQGIYDEYLKNIKEWRSR